MKFFQFFKLLGIAFLAFAFLSNEASSQTRRESESEGKRYREADNPTKPVIGKFIKDSPDAVKGEYVVVLKDSTPEDEVAVIFKEFKLRYKIELIGGEKDGIWTSALKGFGCYADENTARIISEDPRVDFVSENVKMPVSTVTPPR